VPAHLGHLLAAVFAPVLIIAGFKWYDRCVDAVDAGAPIPRRHVGLALASAGAGIIHLAVCPEHFRETVLFGAFFAVAAVAQLVWADRILRADASDRLLVWGALGNAAVLVLWVVSRTTGLPIGPDAGVAEGVGPLDTLAGVLEVAIVLAGLWAALPATASASAAKERFGPEKDRVPVVPVEPALAYERLDQTVGPAAAHADHLG
jgi:hypothetical protein